jgi:hypothetical protein
MKRDAVHRLPATVRLEQGIATWAMVLRSATSPEDRRKAFKEIRELQRRLTIAKGAKDAS